MLWLRPRLLRRATPQAVLRLLRSRLRLRLPPRRLGLRRSCLVRPRLGLRRSCLARLRLGLRPSCLRRPLLGSRLLQTGRRPPWQLLRLSLLFRVVILLLELVGGGASTAQPLPTDGTPAKKPRLAINVAQALMDAKSLKEAGCIDSPTFADLKARLLHRE